MKLYLNLLKRYYIIPVILSVIYLVLLVVFAYTSNKNSIILHEILVYDYASRNIDFFLPIFVSIPFAFSMYFMKKNGFINYASIRSSEQNYIKCHVLVQLTLVFTMIFIVNVVGIIVSCQIADISDINMDSQLSNAILGSLQIEQPYIFGIIWSLHKAFICSLICLFAQITAYYIENFFLAMLAPFIYIVVENFITGVIGLETISFTTTFILNRLAYDSVNIFKIYLSVCIFMGAMIYIRKKLREKQS